MKQFFKYTLLVNVIFILLFELIAITNIQHENYKKTQYTQEEINAIHARGEPVAMPTTGPWLILSQIFDFLLVYIVPLCVIILSGFYQYKNPTFGSYTKSLLIPLFYIIFAILSVIFIPKPTISGDEGGMMGLILLMQFAVTFSTVVIVNLIIYLLRRGYVLK